MKHLCTLTVIVFGLLFLPACQTGNTPADTDRRTATAASRLSPQRVDIRGGVVSRRYNEGQVVLEVEAFATSPDSRYNRAYVLVLPTTQIIDPNGQSISLSELQMGQNVAILLRGGGRGNFVGIGVARKLWVEDAF